MAPSAGIGRQPGTGAYARPEIERRAVAVVALLPTSAATPKQTHLAVAASVTPTRAEASSGPASAEQYAAWLRAEVPASTVESVYGDPPAKTGHAVLQRVSLTLKGGGWVFLLPGADQSFAGFRCSVGGARDLACSTSTAANGDLLVTQTVREESGPGSGATTQTVVDVRADGTWISAGASDATIDPSAGLIVDDSGKALPVSAAALTSLG